jgi:hypothetical protein
MAGLTLDLDTIGAVGTVDGGDLRCIIPLIADGAAAIMGMEDITGGTEMFR